MASNDSDDDILACSSVLVSVIVNQKPVISLRAQKRKFGNNFAVCTPSCEEGL